MSKLEFKNGSTIETLNSKDSIRGKEYFYLVDIDQKERLNNLSEAFKDLGIAIKYTDGTFREFGCVMLDLQKIWSELEELEN